MESRRKAHKAADKLFGCVNELAGITATLRHIIKCRESENDELKVRIAMLTKELKDAKMNANASESAGGN